MKIPYLLQILIILFISAFILSSCKKEEVEEPIEDNSPLKKVFNLRAPYINALFSIAGQPEMSNHIKYNVDIYTYTFPMTYKEKQINASGLIAVPVSQGNSFPLLGFQHATMVAKSEAPSLTYSQPQTSFIAAIAGAGYIVVMPDLVGFGSSSEYNHPYLVKESNVLAVLTMIEEVYKLNKGELSGTMANDSLFLAGYSQGGWITLATLQTIESISKELPFGVIATACGAGPYNPQSVLDFVIESTSYPRPFFLPYVLLSFIEDGTLANNLNNYFKEPYPTRIPGLFDGSKKGDQIDANLTTSVSDFITPELLNYKNNVAYIDLQASFNKNKMNAWNNLTPIYFIHGTEDTYIPVLISETIYNDFINLGSDNILFDSISGTDHNTTAPIAISKTLEWFQQFRE